MAVLKSEVIYEDLKNRICAGEFNQTLKLPSEKVLSEYYGCSRPTLRKALKTLEMQKIITRRQGAGSFITSSGQKLSQKKNVKREQSSLFGIIFPSLGDNYVFDSICGEVTRILAQENCSLVWGGTVIPSSVTLFEDVIQICAKYIELKVEGVFFCPIEYTSLRDEVNTYVLETFAAAQIPLVLIDSDIVDFPERTAHDLVSLDHMKASYIVTKHMIDQNVRNIHFLSPPASARTIKLRQIGYREALYDAGISIQSERIHEGSPHDISFVKNILAMGAQGIVCSNDGTAVTLLHSLHTLGVQVPQDMVVAGFDNLSYLSQIRTPLTSILQPIELISREAVQLMISRITQPSRPTRAVRFPGVLIVRCSTKFGGAV